MKQVLKLGQDNGALRAKATEVTPDEIETLFASNSLIDQMVKVLDSTKGVGLAANQIGVPKKVILIKSNNSAISGFLNPSITKMSPQKVNSEESCLSCDGAKTIQRSKWIKVRSMDKNGKYATLKFVGTEAIILQHEIDHLNGVLIVDY